MPHTQYFQYLHAASREVRSHASRLCPNLEMEEEPEPLCAWAPELPWGPAVAGGMKVFENNTHRGRSRELIMLGHYL